jgi:hypothetical protein
MSGSSGRHDGHEPGMGQGEFGLVGMRRGQGHLDAAD